MSNAGGPSQSVLAEAGERTRDAAKYLVAAFGAVGAVLISGLSLTALPSGRHPVIAALAVLIAVAAIAFAIDLIIGVILPDPITPSDLARLQQEHPEDTLIVYLNSNTEQLGGQGSDLVAVRDRYLAALNARASCFDDYIAALAAGTPDSDAVRTARSASEVASARVQFLAPLMGQLLEVAGLYRLRQRFLDVKAQVAGAALLVAAVAALYAWASAAPTKDAPKPALPKKTSAMPNCVAYYLSLDHLVDDETRSLLARHPTLFPLDQRAKACGFTSSAQLTVFVEYLSGR